MSLKNSSCRIVTVHVQWWICFFLICCNFTTFQAGVDNLMENLMIYVFLFLLYITLCAFSRICTFLDSDLNAYCVCSWPLRFHVLAYVFLPWSQWKHLGGLLYECSNGILIRQRQTLQNNYLPPVVFSGVEKWASLHSGCDLERISLCFAGKL